MMVGGRSGLGDFPGLPGLVAVVIGAYSTAQISRPGALVSEVPDTRSTDLFLDPTPSLYIRYPRYDEVPRLSAPNIND